MYRVIQVDELGEETVAFFGSEYDCKRWVEFNIDNYPESFFYIEEFKHA